jgi:hypothetical protein
MSSFYYLIKREIEHTLDPDAAVLRTSALGDDAENVVEASEGIRVSKRLFSEIEDDAGRRFAESLVGIPEVAYIGDATKVHCSCTKQTCKTIEFNYSDLLSKLNTSNIDDSNKMFYQHVLSGIAYIHENFSLCQMNQHKYVYLEHMYNNMFTHNLREPHLNLFYLVQKIHHGFSQLARLYKYRKAHIHNTCDLTTIAFPANVLQFPATWSSLSATWSSRSVDVWSVLQHGSLYFFNRRDLTQLLNTALGNAPYFFAEPLKCKNPYNNVFFTKADLYNMYSFIRSGGMKISSLIHEFYMCEFQLDLFKMKNENHILEYAINILVNNGDTDELHEHVIEMLETYMPKKVPHEDFPKENLVDVMRPYLVFYLYVEWISYRRKYNLRVLLQNLHIFYLTNPQYGRKIITKTPDTFGQRAFAQPSLQQLTRQVTSSPNEFGKSNTSFITKAVRPPIIVILQNSSGQGGDYASDN